ncbi:MAG TPA: sigma-70 family RNA polymerase sigma factor [Bacteroidetes bacterium]|nr:sigma-70 family RNA polymerase sigma factor [Bacteroidota bacterium]HIL58062.1 sigma-70 family RNA polymerase sigma factor [Rhodothermales bacterium]
MPPAGDVTALLAESRAGDSAAADRLLSAVYDELHRLAKVHRSRSRRDATLNTTALVHEAYFKLVDGDRLPFDGRAHFFSAAARAMRQVVVDDARKRGRIKRGGGERPTSLDRVGEPAADEPATEILALDEALRTFETLDPRAARVVECRYFAGLTVEETAEALGVSPTTVKREWAAARAWLYRAMSEG